MTENYFVPRSYSPVDFASMDESAAPIPVLVVGADLSVWPRRWGWRVVESPSRSSRPPTESRLEAEQSVCPGIPSKSPNDSASAALSKTSHYRGPAGEASTETTRYCTSGCPIAPTTSAGRWSMCPSPSTSRSSPTNCSRTHSWRSTGPHPSRASTSSMAEQQSTSTPPSAPGLYGRTGSSRPTAAAAECASWPDFVCPATVIRETTS